MRVKHYHENRLKVFQKLSGKEVPDCKYCGCDVYKVLELNHRNGGGGKDKKNHATFDIIREILNGKRDINDYEVTCKVCNWEYFAEQKWGLHWNIKFIKQPPNIINNPKSE